MIKVLFDCKLEMYLFVRLELWRKWIEQNLCSVIRGIMTHNYAEKMSLYS
jgi:hypothetical protein